MSRRGPADRAMGALNDRDAMGWRVYRPFRRGRISSARADGTRMKLSSIESLVRALNDARVRFLVVGGLAVVAHGYGRQTQDVDLVIRLRPDSIGAAFAALSSLGYRPRVRVTAEMLSDRATRDALVRDRGMLVPARGGVYRPSKGRAAGVSSTATADASKTACSGVRRSNCTNITCSHRSSKRRSPLTWHRVTRNWSISDTG